MDRTQDSGADDPRDNLYTGAGFLLRTAREEQGLSLTDIAARTRVPMRQLEVIEAGGFDALPSRTYAIGFARTYCRALGLDETAVIAAVRAELGDAAEPGLPAASTMEPGDPAKLPSKGLAWAAVIAAAVLALGLFAWFGNYFGAGKGAAPLVAEASEEAAPDAAGPDAAGSAIGGAGDAGSAAAPDPAGEVVFTALEDGVWVRLYEQGGARLFERQLAKGESFAVPSGASDPRLNTGRPDALAITIGGTAAARLAERAISMGDVPVSAAALLARGTDAAPVPAPAPAPARAATRTPRARASTAAAPTSARTPAPTPARSRPAAASPARGASTPPSSTPPSSRPAAAPSPAAAPTVSPTASPSPSSSPLSSPSPSRSVPAAAPSPAATPAAAPPAEADRAQSAD